MCDFELPKSFWGYALETTVYLLNRSTRVRTKPELYGFLIDDDQNITLLENDEPKSYDEFLKSSERDLWLKTMKSEMDFMSKNQVWTLLDAPEGVKPIRCKWVFKKKTNMERKVVTYKARLVAKCYQHVKILIMMKLFHQFL